MDGKAGVAITGVTVEGDKTGIVDGFDIVGD